MSNRLVDKDSPIINGDQPGPDISSRPGVTATADMTVLPGVLGYRTLRRTVQVRLGSNPLRLPGTRRKRLRCAWHTLLHGLATPIREISGLAKCCREQVVYSNPFWQQ